MAASLNIKLTPSMKKWLDEQLADSEGSAEQYLRTLLQKERRRQERRKIEDALEAGLNSGPPIPFTEENWNRIKAAARKRPRKKSG